MTSEYQNRYNPNAGAQGDLIDQLIKAGYDDSEIAQILQQQASGAGLEEGSFSATPVDASTGLGDSGISLEDLQLLTGADPEQQGIENLAMLYELLGQDQPKAQQREPALSAEDRLTLAGSPWLQPGANYMSAPNDFAAGSYDLTTPGGLMAASAAGLGRKRAEAEKLLASPIQSEAQAPASNPTRDAIMQALIEKLLPKAKAETPAAPVAPANQPVQQIPAAGYAPGAGGWSQLTGENFTPGTANLLEELRKKAVGQQDSGGGFGPIGSTILGKLRGIL